MCQIILGRPQQAIAAHTALCETFDTAFPESCRVWSGEALEGLSLLICMRGGPGDELRVATMCLPWLLSQNLERCTFACDPRLETLLTRTFPEVSFRPTFSGHRLVRRAADERKARVDRAWPGISNRTAEMSVSYSEAPRHDVITHSDRLVHHAYFEGSLLDGKKPACRPLVVDRDRADSFRDMLAGLGPHLKVGLCWRGSYSSAYRNKLFLDIEDILPILQTDGACFIDLQVNKTAEESEKLALAGVHSIPELDLYDDFEGQAALISRLDLVITPGITIRDVAGCLQVPVWSVIIAPGADDLWRSGEDASDCWQSSIKHYGIDLLKTRAALMAQIAGDLANLVESKEKYRKPSKAKQRAS